MTETNTTAIDPSTWPSLDLILGADALTHLARQIQYGGFVPAPAGAALSVRQYMVGVLGLDPDYVERRVATVFLDGKAVDDLDASHVHPGSCLSLSAAMPGVAGIVMRRKSPFSRMRALELLGDDPGALDGDECGGLGGAVEVKLFNFIAVEAGPVLLERGLGLSAGRLAKALDEADFAAGVAKAALDGGIMAPAELAAELASLSAADPAAPVLVTARGA